MLTQRLRQRVPNARPIGVACAGGRELRFEKRSSDGSGKCNIPISKDREKIVYGVLFAVPENEVHLLDKAEGDGYERTSIDVSLTGGAVVSATVYFARSNAIDAALNPYDWYHQLVINGARQHALPDSYASIVSAVKSLPDPKPDRESRLEALEALQEALSPLNHPGPTDPLTKKSRKEIIKAGAAAIAGAAAAVGGTAVTGGMGLSIAGTAIAIGTGPVALAGAAIGLAGYGIYRLVRR